MGEVRRPKDIVTRRGKPAPDLSPRLIPRQIPPSSLDDVLREIGSLKADIAKIKRVLRDHGITVE